MTTTMTDTQQALFDYLTDYVTDEKTANLIIKGGEQGYYYGNGGYVQLDREADKEAISEAIANDDYVVDDIGLEYVYLIGNLQ